MHKDLEAYPKSAERSIDINLKSAQKPLRYPKSAHRSINNIPKSPQKPLKVS